MAQVDMLGLCYHLCCTSAPCDDPGAIRLKGSTSGFRGRVEVCSERSWSEICGEVWDSRDADVACRQLGFVPYGNLCTIIH